MEQRPEPELLSAENEASFADAPDEIKYLIRKYYPLVWQQPSPYVDGGFVLTLTGLIQHAKAAQKAKWTADSKLDTEQRIEGRAKRQRNAEKGAEWVEWQRQCSARNAWIESLNAEWRARVAARKAAIAGWDAHVEQARASYQAAKLTPAPVQPA